MNKKILVTVLSISLLHFSTHTMSNSATSFFSGVKKFFLPYEVIDHTYKTDSRGCCRPRYKLVPTDSMPGAFVIQDDTGNLFHVSSADFSPIKDKNGVFFVEKSAENKIKEKQDEYAVQTNTLASSPDVSLKAPRVFYRDYVGKHGLSFILNYPRTATSLKYAALLGIIYEGYSWLKPKKTPERVFIDADTEIEVK